MTREELRGGDLGEAQEAAHAEAQRRGEPDPKGDRVRIDMSGKFLPSRR